jgi:D-alanyl-D-alanine endopeptidase (penicillin-binding protein 7)
MSTRRKCIAWAALILVAAQASAQEALAPRLKSSAALILDPLDSSVWYSRHAHVAAPIASITKLMTALVVLDGGQPLLERLRVTPLAPNVRASIRSRLAVGTLLSRGELLHIALMSSDNRAAQTLGAYYPGGLSAMVAAMNATATSLGMVDTHFVDCTGLSSENVASPEDLSKLVIAAAQNPTIRAYSTDSRYAVRVSQHLVEYHNTDNLVANPSWHILVQKTGTITAAGKCLVMEAIIEGRRVVIVLLHSAGRFTRLADAQRVKRWLETPGTGRIRLSAR